MTPQQTAQVQLEEMVRRQVAAQVAEGYNFGINANIDYSNKVLYDMEKSGLFYFSKKPKPKYQW